MLKRKKAFRENLTRIILFLCVISFLLLAKNIFTHETFAWDSKGQEFISKYLVKDNITPIVKGITWFGGAIALLLITFLLWIGIKNKKIGISIGANLVINTTLNQALKTILHRPRPEGFRIIKETGYSFPSGHSMVSMAFYGYLIYLIYKHIKNKYLKCFLITTLSLLIFLIGVSRVYLGVHYISDVIAGFVISIAYLIVFIHRINKGNRGIKMKNKKLINSFKYAFTGIASAFKTERNMKIHGSVMILVILCGILLKISLAEWMICMICFACVIGAEMFNTAIEKVVDLASPEKNELAKLSKDIAAGAVLIFAICSAGIGLVIFVPKVLLLFS